MYKGGQAYILVMVLVPLLSEVVCFFRSKQSLRYTTDDSIATTRPIRCRPVSRPLRQWSSLRRKHRCKYTKSNVLEKS